MRHGAVVALLVVSIWCHPPSTSASKTYGFDYLVLARTWPPSFCEQERCTQPTYNLFTIHGLWPSNKDGNGPADCPSAITFSTQKLDPELKGRMSCEWRSFKGDNAGLWNHEWEKHGTCALPLFPDVNAYFGNAVALSEKYDINEAMVSGGINPLVTQSVTPQQLVGILEQSWDVTPVVTCSNGNIYEVKMCFSTALKPIDCPFSSRSCSSTAQDMPYGSDEIPQACSTYFDNIPAGTNPSAVPPPQRTPPPPKSGAAAAARAWGAAAAAAAAVLLAAL